MPPHADPTALGEVMLRVIQDPAYCAQLGRDSLDLVKGHSEEATFQSYEKLYKSLLSE
jgi:hypothetical protein